MSPEKAIYFRLGRMWSHKVPSFRAHMLLRQLSTVSSQETPRGRCLALQGSVQELEPKVMGIPVNAASGYPFFHTPAGLPLSSHLPQS